MNPREPEHKDGRLRFRRQPAKNSAYVVWPLAVAGLAPFLFILGGCYVLWAKQTGTPARVQITECHGYGRRQACSGLWTMGDLLQGGSVRSIEIDDATSDDLGKTLDARISGDRAYTTSLRVPIILIALGVALQAAFLATLRKANRNKSKRVGVSTEAAATTPPFRAERR